MPFFSANGLKWFQFESLDHAFIKHGVFTRHGGVSSGQFSTLNIGGSNGDDPNCVVENRRRLFTAMDHDPLAYHDLWQTHSDIIHDITSFRPQTQKQQEGDAMVTRTPGVALLMRFGDCVPILMADPVKKVIALAHAGWLGAYRCVVEKTALHMQERYGCAAEDIVAGIGPSICPERYEIGDDLSEQFREKFPEFAGKILAKNEKSGKDHLDLWTLLALQLARANVQQVEIAGICTANNTQDWFSHRGEHGKTGRFGAFITIV